ncbi:hypothetical protein CONPUDRAFT_166178 [Coniophora puteana RWD-64-598 SS2]|uniref:Nephrocystin 3-like N-terminal domain-containing protein n=1 Tax=Coniophora puteana (strain RWD-64-598) TaxID=741705 RepID=A0A5M3MNM3_CONPW|nr:uncharacterized protein CONPUDRAFT_166178 [Coniophora puteana RWD-64-598 SS2]EIW80758.1 hypothetical protein CONPUDRAFT_166178 [Coniophora puteana RWD-64-598 SS2]
MDPWNKLAQEIAVGAVYDSNERQPHSKCLPGTRVRLLEALHQHVGDPARKIVWLSGESGCGKSTVAHTLAEELRRADKLAGTFFFSRKHTKRSTFDHVILTLAYQLGLHHPQAREVIAKAISDDPSLLSTERSHRDQLEALVIAPLKELAFIWKERSQTGMSIILDALDEGTASGVEHLLPFISLLACLLRDNGIPIVNIILTSRPLPHIGAVMNENQLSATIRTVQVEHHESREDVPLYLQHEFKQIYDAHDMSNSFDPRWPPESDLVMLAQHASGRFIFAATVVRLIKQNDQPRDQLPLVCEMIRGHVTRVWGNIEHLYSSIIDHIDASIRSDGLKYLSLVVSLADTLSPQNLRILFRDVDVYSFLLPFSALISLPPRGSPDPVQIYHASLRDFLQNRGQIRDTDNGQYPEPDLHHRLASNCFRTMATLLRHDICNLRDPSLLHSEIPDFAQRRDDLPRALLYACRHWLYHIQHTSPDGETYDLLADFMKQRVLFAIEAYAIFGELDTCIVQFRAARQLVMGWDGDYFPDKDKIMELLYDSWRLTMTFFDPISASALHVYESALPFAPAKSEIRLVYNHVQPTSFHFEHGLDDDWDCTIRIVHPNRDVYTIALSPDTSHLAIHAYSSNLAEIWDMASGIVVKTRRLEFPDDSEGWSTISYSNRSVAISLYPLPALLNDPSEDIAGRWKARSEIWMWDLSSDTVSSINPIGSELLAPSMTLSYDGAAVASLWYHPIDWQVDGHCVLRVHNAHSHDQLLEARLKLKTDAIIDLHECLEFSYDGKFLLCYPGIDQSAYIINVDRGEIERVIKHHWLDDSRLLFGLSSNSIIVLGPANSRETPRVLPILLGSSESPQQPEWISLDGSKVGIRIGGMIRAIGVGNSRWNSQTEEIFSVLQLEDESLRIINLSRAATRQASSSTSFSETAYSEECPQFQPFDTIQFSPDNTIVAVLKPTMRDSPALQRLFVVYSFERDALVQLTSLPLPGGNDEEGIFCYYILSVTRRGIWLLRTTSICQSGGDPRHLLRWNRDTRDVIEVTPPLKGPSTYIGLNASVALSPNGKRLYGPFSSRTNAMNLKNPENYPLYEQANNPDSIVYEPDQYDGPAVIFDAHSWSDLCVDADGWLRQRSRRICWLPPRYRPHSLRQNGLKLRIDGNKVTILGLSDGRRITIRLLNTDIQYYDSVDPAS